MIVLNAHLEFGMGTVGQKVVVMSLHPGTVDTHLSKPFQQIAAKQYDIFTPEHSASMLVDLCEKCDETYFFTLLKLRYLKLKTYNVCMFLKTCNFGIKGNKSLK